jgi:hypothetical protein
MNLFKQLIVAGALVLAGVAANATVIRGTYVPMDSGDPGDFDTSWTIDSSTLGGIAKGEDFIDYFVFNVPDDEYISFSLSSGKITFDGFNLFSLGWDVELVDSEAASLPHSLSGGVYKLTSGTYELDIYGTATSKNAHYELDIFGSPVPEPASWALLMAGIGAVGSLSRRRSKQLS